MARLQTIGARIEREPEANKLAVADHLRTSTKTLEDVKADMSKLYEEVRAGTTDLKLAGELANITGKFLKAEQLKLAREIFQSPAHGLVRQ